MSNSIHYWFQSPKVLHNEENNHSVRPWLKNKTNDQVFERANHEPTHTNVHTHSLTHPLTSIQNTQIITCCNSQLQRNVCSDSDGKVTNSFWKFTLLWFQNDMYCQLLSSADVSRVGSWAQQAQASSSSSFTNYQTSQYLALPLPPAHHIL